MLVGVPKEIKDNEFRVGLTPASVAELTHHGHQVLVEKVGRHRLGSPDAEYVAAGATIVAAAREIFRPRRDDREGQGAARRGAQAAAARPDPVHLSASGAGPRADRDLIASGATCIAYETVTSPHGGLPLLTPMSEVAGRLAPQVGAHALEKAQGGRGILLGGVPGVPAAEVIVLGGGVSGTHAATIALGMGANVTVVDKSNEALRRLSAQFGTGAAHDLFDARHDRGTREARRPPHRRGVGAGRRRAEAGHPRDARDDEARRRHRRRRDRPGRLLRDVKADDAFAPDLCRRRHRALLRRQHAGRGGAHLDLRPQSCDLAVRAGARRQGLARGA